MFPEQLRDEHYTFFVPSPESFFQSNGIRVMLDAIQAAFDLGIKVSLVPSHDRNAWYNRLPEPYQHIPVRWQVPDGCRAIISDTILPDLLDEVRERAKSVCHYTLAPWGLFRDCGSFSNFQTIKPGEAQAVYSPHVSEHAPPFYLQTRFEELEPWIAWTKAGKGLRNGRNPHRKLKACIYPGKGYPTKLEEDQLRSLISRPRSKLITRWDPVRGHPLPPTKAELYRLLASSDLLISFDPISSLAHEAILLGIPCLVKAPWDEEFFWRNFPVRLDGIAWNDEHEMIRLIKEGFDHDLVLESYREAIANNTRQLLDLLVYATQPNGNGMQAKEINMYWKSRQEFFKSLALPSDRDSWGGVGKTLRPLHINDYISDLLDCITASWLWTRYKTRSRQTKATGWAKHQMFRVVRFLKHFLRS